MALYVNGTEMENVYFEGTKIDRVFANGTLVYESTIYVDKPTLSGVFVYDKTVKQVTVTGYDSTAMTLSGAIEATEAGTYHAYFTLNKGYAWTDGTTDKLDLTWTINKRPIAIPSLSGTSFTWLEGTTHTVTVNNLDADYATQSGTLSQKDASSNIGAKYTVTWALKNANSTYWSDSTTANKSATWGVYWTDGTSHYSNDLYNRGWNSGLLKAGAGGSDELYYPVTVDWGGASQPYITATGSNNGSALFLLAANKYLGKTFHATVRASSSNSAASVHSVKYGSIMASTDCDSSSSVHKSTEWGEIWGKDDSAGTYYGGLYGIYMAIANRTLYVQRIWLT